MKQFNWKEFKNTNNKIAVHCKTEEEAKDFCKQMHEHDMKWANGESFLNNDCFYVYKKDTCYYAKGTRSEIQYAKENDITILEWSDYIQKEFTKADLKDGMVIEVRDGNRFLKLGDYFRSVDEYEPLRYYYDGLTNSINSDCDVTKVFVLGNENYCDIDSLLRCTNLKLIWERKDTVFMTTEEMRQNLEELTGKKIESKDHRRVGNWILLDECSNAGVYCSICRKKVYKKEYANQKVKSKYCPNCGAIMEN